MKLFVNPSFVLVSQKSFFIPDLPSLALSWRRSVQLIREGESYCPKKKKDLDTRIPFVQTHGAMAMEQIVISTEIC